MGGLLLTSVLCWFWMGVTTKGCVAGTSWFSFGTSPFYRDYRMITSEKNTVDPLYISKETPMLWAKMDCAQSCGKDETCLGFNFYETSSDYVCEMLPDNYCRNLASKLLLPWPGNLLFDKLSDGATTSCFEVMFNSTTGFDCKILRPGCLGSWPNCTSCVQSSIDWSKRYGSTAVVKPCTVWPDGDAPSSLPIFGRCYNEHIFLIFRTVDQSTGEVTADYRMSFPDMNRLYKLGVYRELRFFFKAGIFGTLYSYLNSYIDANGTLMNMTFLYWFLNPGDAFNLNGRPLPPTPFVTVLDDRYGCGSFWLLDSTNATYCPGGKLGMLGQVQFSGTTATSSGMRCPNCATSVVPEANLMLMK